METQTQETNALEPQDTQAVETEAQDVESKEPEAETQESDEDSTNTEGEEGQEPEISIEQRLEQLEKDNAGKQKAIDRKTAAFHDLQRAYERKLQEFKSLEQKVQGQEVDKEPSIDDFDTFEEYDKAKTDYVRNQAVKEAQQELINKQREEQMKAMAQKRAELVNSQEAEYIKTNPNYRNSKLEFEAYLKSLEVPSEVERAFVDQAFKGNVPQFIDYFGRNNGENLDKLNKLANMTPVEVGIEVYKIQQELKTPKTVKEDKPKPKPLERPKGVGATKKSLDNMSGEEILKTLGLK